MDFGIYCHYQSLASEAEMRAASPWELAEYVHAINHHEASLSPHARRDLKRCNRDAALVLADMMNGIYRNVHRFVMGPPDTARPLGVIEIKAK